ncbi:hypothetical protein [Citrobacter koseri]|uniref:hypothetical protein n=1 Tax=Citrobacter koseri TaxID=545 RepID=UPI0023AEDE84|nr:hypothetical protein [Citrobacter koseri]
MSKKEFFLPIIVGLIGVFGTLLGVVVTNYEHSESERENRIYLYKSKIIDQRIQLIDRAANIFGQSPGLEDVWHNYHDAINKREVDRSIIDRLSSAQGEFQSVVFLSAVYFGPKTRQALKELSDYPGPWWAKPKEKQDGLIVSMTEEIRYQLLD